MTLRVRVFDGYNPNVYSYGVYGFGTPSQVKQGTDCPIGGSWENWCDCVFGPDTQLGKACKGKPLGPLTSPPWTDVGATERGIPKQGNLVAGIIGGAATNLIANLTGQPTPAQQEQADRAKLDAAKGADKAAKSADKKGGGATATPAPLFGIPKTLAIVGGGILVVGTGLVIFTRKKKGKTDGKA